MSQLVGWVRKVKTMDGYGFICTDAYPNKQFFFRKEHTTAGELPAVDTVVRFRPVMQNIPNRNDRAVDVEVA